MGFGPGTSQFKHNATTTNKAGDFCPMAYLSVLDHFALLFVRSH